MNTNIDSLVIVTLYGNVIGCFPESDEAFDFMKDTFGFSSREYTLCQVHNHTVGDKLPIE